MAAASALPSSAAALSPMTAYKASRLAAKIASGSPKAASSLRCVRLPMPATSVSRNQSRNAWSAPIAQGVRT